MRAIQILLYSTTCLKQPLKKRTNIGFQERFSLNAGQKYCRMLQESILQYFRPSLSYHLSLIPLSCLFVRGCLRQVSLYFSRNRLTELPSCVGKVKNLKSLHIEYNKISKLCEEMGELIHLEDLVITCDSEHFLPCYKGQNSLPNRK